MPILTIRNQADRAEVMIYDLIGDHSTWWEDRGVTVENVLDELSIAEGKPLHVRINSEGGNVFEGIAIYNALKRYEGRVVVHVDALAASIASVIAMAGDEIVMGIGSQMMIHDPMGGFNVFGTASEIQQQVEKFSKQVLNALQACRDSILDIYSKRSRDKISREALSQMMSEETYITAKHAVEIGFADRVEEGAPTSELKESLVNMLKRSDSEPIHQIYNSIFNHNEDKTMPKSNTGTTQQGLSNEELQKIRNQAFLEAQKAETARKEKISNLFQKFPNLVNLKNECLIDSNTTYELANKRLLEALANEEHVRVVSPSEPIASAQVLNDRAEEGIDEALKAMAEGKHDYTNEYASITPVGLLAHIANRNGYAQNFIGKSSESIVNSLIGNPQVMDDFQIKIGDYIQRVAQFAYENQATTYRQFTRQRTLKDFREHEIYARGTLGRLELKGADGNYKTMEIPDDEKQGYRADERGGIVQIDRKVLINDEWGTIQGQAEDAGLVADQTVEELVYRLLLSNPTLKDGVPLFHVSRGNVLAQKEMNEETWELYQDYLETLKAPGSSTFLRIQPKHLLTDRRGWGKAKALNTLETGKEASLSAGTYEMKDVIHSPYMRGKPEIYLGNAPIVEVGWVGEQGPKLITESHFNSGSYRARMTLDVGVGIIGWRGAATREAATNEGSIAESRSVPTGKSSNTQNPNQPQGVEDDVAILSKKTNEQLIHVLDALAIDHSSATVKQEYVALVLAHTDLQGALELIDG